MHSLMAQLQEVVKGRINSLSSFISITPWKLSGVNERANRFQVHHKINLQLFIVFECRRLNVTSGFMSFSLNFTRSCTVAYQWQLTTLHFTYAMSTWVAAVRKQIMLPLCQQLPVLPSISRKNEKEEVFTHTGSFPWQTSVIYWTKHSPDVFPK